MVSTYARSPDTGSLRWRDMRKSNALCRCPRRMVCLLPGCHGKFDWKRSVSFEAQAFHRAGVFRVYPKSSSLYIDFKYGLVDNNGRYSGGFSLTSGLLNH